MLVTRTWAEPLSISEQDLAHFVLDRTDAAVVVCDSRGIVVLANPAALALADADPLGQPFSNAYRLIWARTESNNDAATLPSPFSLDPVLAGEALRRVCLLEKEGQPRREVAVSSAPCKGPGGGLLCCIISMIEVVDAIGVSPDVTAPRQDREETAERKRVEQAQALEQSRSNTSELTAGESGSQTTERTLAEETTRALLRISSKLNSTLDVEATFEILIDEAMRFVGGESGFAGLRTVHGMCMRRFLVNGKSIELEHTWAPGVGIPGWVLEHRAPYVTNDAPRDPFMPHALPFNRDVRNAICTPILGAGGEVVGFFEIRNKAGRAPFTQSDVDFLMALSPIACIAIENAQAYKRISDAEGAVKDSYTQLRALAARLQTIREEERTEIARELHDELGQALTALKMDLVSLAALLPKRNALLRERARAMTDQIDATIKTVRRLSSHLRPVMLDDLGLGPSLEWYAQEFQTRTGIIVESDILQDELALDQSQATALFRIFQETLTNVARHANATRVNAKLELRAGELVLCIQDNGQGFEVDKVRGNRSLGLLGMRERAENVRGTLEIQGAPGQGTIILVTVPLEVGGSTSQVD
ncbi:MAG: GAF domain-containing sensor histidine kinase [Anaerolineae bacterium]|nr:GAF domain-containing sensor histidine kinase [Anaerolineae bacterium]